MKWQAFKAVTTGEEIISSLECERNKIEKPILSHDQTEILTSRILEYYHSGETIKVNYYSRGVIHQQIGIIKKIDSTMKLIQINNLAIYLDTIIDVKV